jgi:hypothetical protein
MTLAACSFRMTGMIQVVDLNEERTPVTLRFEISVLMATQAVTIGHPLIVEYFPYFVRLVAVHTRRECVRFLFPEFTPDDFSMHDLNLRMAFRAGLRNVLSCNGRFGIGVRKDRVRGVACCTIRRDGQPFLQETFSMDALRKVFNNIVLMDGTLPLNNAPFLVTLPAGERDLHRRNG